MNVKVGGWVDGQYRTASLLELGEALDAILAQAIEDPTKSRVVNISWGTVRSSWLDAKIQNLLSAGITVVAAAGNSSISVDDISPAGMRDVITVGSIDKYDIPSGFNNIAPGDAGLTTGTGLSLDIFAPGEDVVVAKGDSNQYIIASGTSLAAPFVSAVACEIAALNSGAILEPELKTVINNTATEDALLFEDDRFSENQNRLLHFIVGDTLAEYKLDGALSYLGTHEEDEEIIIDLHSIIDTGTLLDVYPDNPFVFSVEVDPSNLEYGPFFSCDPATGVVTISKPNLPFAEDEKLRMVKFTAAANNGIAKLTTTEIFFFDVNPDYSDNIESDITLALTEINSISFFNFWTFPNGQFASIK